MMTDPVADMLTRIRNATRIKNASVRIPLSRLKVQIADVLQREGYVTGYEVLPPKPADGQGPQGWLKVDLKYGADGEEVIAYLQRVSRPGRRVYRQAAALKPVLNGLGISIISTSSGVLSDREARKRGVGGEVLAEVH